MSSAARLRSWSLVGRGLDVLRSTDPLLLLLRSSLIVLLINNNDDPMVFLGLAAVCVVVLPRPRVLTNPWFWGALFLAVGTRQLVTWHTIDDHIIVTTYWTGAIALALTASNRLEALGASARFLVGALFAFAAAWKLGSGQFIDGSFFRYSLLFDGRFETPAHLLGGTSVVMREANLSGLQSLYAAGAPGGSLALAEGPHNHLIAVAFTGWGAAIETTIAAVFLVPLRARWAWLRHAALAAFAATTYLVVPVGGFGALLLLLGAAQTSTDHGRSRYYVGGMVLLVWAGLWPWLFGP